VIIRKEFLDLIRDRRTVFVAFVLPVFVYPCMLLLGSGSGPRAGAIVRIGIEGAPPGLESRLAAEQLRVESGVVDSGGVKAGIVAAYLSFPEPDRVIVYHASASPGSREALSRLRRAFEGWKRTRIEERFVSAGLGRESDAFLALESVDVSSEEERAKGKAGAIFPLLLVVLLLTGGSFAALDLIAGEKERGTLETLFVHPIPARAIVRGKFLVLLGVSLVSFAANLLGFLLGIVLGAWLGGIPGLENAFLAVPSPGGIVSLAVLSLPLVLLSSAVLLGISARAHSFREGQMYLLPAILVFLLLALPVLVPAASLGGLLALVPVANTALLLRGIFEGTLEPVPTAIAFGASVVAAFLSLGWVERLLEREDVIFSLERASLLADGSAEGRARRGLYFGALTLLLVYFAAPLLQAKDPRLGLALTLWVVVLVPAILYPLVARLPFRETLGLRRASLADGILVPLLAPVLAILAGAWLRFQEGFLRTPRVLEDAVRELFGSGGFSPTEAALLLVISPAICEELLWRGAFLGELLPRRRPFAAVLWSGVFFGLFHLSAYRLVPAGVLGALLAYVRLRTGSILPCMLLHASYNAVLLAASSRSGEEGASLLESLSANPTAVILSIGGLFAGLCLLGRSTFREPAPQLGKR
jgi:sodium transport system permease protein